MGPFWDGVIADAWESPIIGHGRCAMRRRPMMVEVCRQIGMGLPEHPHCAYLQLWHESGFVGVVIVLSLFFTAWWLALTVARDRRDPLFRAVGGAALAAITALIIMGISGQSFFPKENNQMCWALMGLLLRVWVERKKKAEGHHDLQSMKEPEGYPMAAHPLYVGR